jgi:hypothetical protein
MTPDLPCQVLHEGALSIIVFGYDERLLWAKRVGTFIRTMRSVLGDRWVASGVMAVLLCKIPGCSGIVREKLFTCSLLPV